MAVSILCWYEFSVVVTNEHDRFDFRMRVKAASLQQAKKKVREWAGDNYPDLTDCRPHLQLVEEQR